jgi:hypothetical protein
MLLYATIEEAWQRSTSVRIRQIGPTQHFPGMLGPLRRPADHLEDRGRTFYQTSMLVRTVTVNRNHTTSGRCSRYAAWCCTISVSCSC